MEKAIKVFTDEDPYLTNVVVQLVTRAGQYTNLNIVRRQIAEGQVSVNGIIQKKPQLILGTGQYTFGVGPNTYLVQLQRSILE